MKELIQYVELLPREGSLYKMNLHTHSTVSDGNFSPAELKRIYQDMRYDAVAFTDHGKCYPHNELTDERFVAVTGVELDFTQKDERGSLVKVVHINALPFDPNKTLEYDSQPLDYALINETIVQLKREGHVVVLNHPVWSNMSSEEIARIRGFDAMEICNSISVMFNNFSDDSALFEYFLREDGRAIPIAADDCHRIFEDGSPFAEYGKSFTYVKASELTHEAILSALMKGQSYASTGPKLHNLWIEKDILHVECDPVFGIYVHSKYLNRKTQRVEKTDSITHAEFDISGIREYSPYLWVQIRDTKGGRAWATPYWFDKDGEA